MKDYDIVVLRALAILTIVLHHSMLAFSWPPYYHIEANVPTYANLMSQSLKDFGLGTFTFISGYVLYYQNKKQEKWKSFLQKKIKRILIPCLFYGLLYHIFFPEFTCNIWPPAINGTHLWYLPMLFICIMITSIDFYYKKSISLIIIVWILFCSLKFLFYSLTIISVFNYFPIFICGYFFNKYDLKNVLSKYKLIAYLIIILSIAWIIKPLNLPFFSHAIKELSYALSCFIIIFLIRKNKTVSVIIGFLSNESFTIYLLHQFIINLILMFISFNFDYYSSLFILSICAFFIPLGISSSLSFIIRYLCKEKSKLDLL